MLPLALETYGRLGKGALKHLQELARGLCAEAGTGAEQWAAVAQLVTWGVRLSIDLHKANARNARFALGSRGPPSRFWPSLVELQRTAS